MINRSNKKNKDVNESDDETRYHPKKKGTPYVFIKSKQ